MTQNNQPICNVKTNIITGFLGVGKTTAIIKLLSKRLPTERWAVLVNEYGEMGIDGHLMQNNDVSITIKQVPGGCICCAAGLPLQVAVNQLLKQTHPNRLIIEPSGMGHPRKIFQSLIAPVYSGVLDMRACICLIDPRKLVEQRYLESELFIDQIDVADRIVANKTDLCNSRDKQGFNRFIQQRYENKSTAWVVDAEIQLEWLNSSHQDSVPLADSFLTQEFELSFNKISINLSLDVIFDIEKLAIVLGEIKAERIKGLFNTNNGFVAVNYSEGACKFEPVTNNSVNRVEIISLNVLNKEAIQAQLDCCILS